MAFWKTPQWLLVYVAALCCIVLAGGAPSEEDPTPTPDLPQDPPRVMPPRYRRILVFGGNGFLGAETVELFINHGDNVTMVNRGNWYWDSYNRIRPYTEHISCDRQNGVESCKELVDLIAATEIFDAVIDFSSYGPNETADAISVLNGKTKLYVLISTDSIYDVSTKEDVQTPSKEIDGVRPEDKGEQERLAYATSYGHKKLQSEEELIKQADTERGVPYVILRLPDVIGARDSTHRWWLYQLWCKLDSRLEAKPITIPSFLKDYKVSFVYSVDVANLIFDSVARVNDVEDQIFNVAYPQVFEVEELIGAIRKELGVKNTEIGIESNQSETLFVYPTVRKGPVNVSKLQEALGWKPTPWEKAVANTVNFFEEAMKGENFNVQKDEIIQIFSSQLFENHKDKVYEAIEKVYDIDLHHFKPRDEL